MNGAEYILNFLKDKGVETSFGYPGGKVLGFYDAMYRMNFPHVLTRHEQGAIHAAEGYARTTGKTGVVISTSGPGATNLVTGIANAHLDSTPIFVICGQVASGYIGKDAFQEADMSGITIPITKHNYLIKDLKTMPDILEEAWTLTQNGRCGPVLVDIPSDYFVKEMPKPVPCDYDVNFFKDPKLTHDTLQKCSEILREAKRPIIIAGGGMNKSDNACEMLSEIAMDLHIPVVFTLMGLGAIPSNHPCAVGLIGMHGIPAANIALAKSDAILSLGCRFGDRVVARADLFAKGKKIIQVDIDSAELSKSVPANLEINARIEYFLSHFKGEIGGIDHSPWLDRIIDKKHSLKMGYKKKQCLLPQQIIEHAAKVNKDKDYFCVTDVGQHQMFAAQIYPINKPNGFITSGGLGTMGFGLPAAIGSAAATGEPTVLFAGDGGIQMTIQELGVASKNQLPVKIFILDNSCLGMVRQWQELFYNGNYSHSILDDNPDFVAIAGAYGIKGYKISSTDDLAIIDENMHTKEPVLFHCVVEDYANVFPIIPPGKDTYDMEGPDKIKYISEDD